jgi:hypothetical protein
MTDNSNVVFIGNVFRSKPELDPEYGLEDMVASLRRGYVAGEKMMDSMFMKNNVFAMDGNSISEEQKVEIPTSDDPDFREGFSAGVMDYMEGNVIDLYDLMQALSKKTG